MSQVPISALPPLATPLNPALQFEVATGTTTSSKVTLSQILTDPIITGSPTITDFTLASHDHSDDSEGEPLTNSALVTGVFSAITGIGTQTTDINMGINNILQSGFLELREITTPDNPAETAGRLYTRDVAGSTILFFLNSLGVETDLLDIGLGTFLPLAGGTMDDTAVITFTNTGNGADPTISVIPSDEQTLTISDNLAVPEIIFLGSGGWNMAVTDADTDFFITTPTGDGSHNFDIVSDTGEISLQNTTLGNDFTAKFFVEQVNSLATSQAIALTIEAQIVDGTDEGPNPVIAINARQAAADIDTRPILGIRNNGTTLWEISKDGVVTQTGNLIMNFNEIRFDDANHRIDQNGNNMEIHNQVDGNITLFLGGNLFRFDKEQANWAKKNILNMNQMAFSNTTTQNTKVVSIQRGDSTINDGNNSSLELDANEGGEIVLRVADDEEYNFSATRADWNANNLSNMGILTFSPDSDVSIQRSGSSLQLVAGESADIDLRIGADEEYSFGPTNADWNFNDLRQLGILSFVDDDNSLQHVGGAGDTGLQIDVGLGEFVFLRVTNEIEYQFGDAQADWKDNDLINMAKLEFTNSSNRIFERQTNEVELRIQADVEVSLKVAGTNQSFTVGKNFIEWDSDTNDAALFELHFTQDTPEAATITTWDYNGINDVFESITYASMEVNQVNIDDGAEDGSMVFSVMLSGSLTDFVSLNGETGKLELQPDIDIDFTDFSGNGVLTLATDNSDDLTFQTSVILTEANVLANRTTGVPLDTDTLLFGNSAGTNLRQATFDDLQFSVMAGNGEGHTTGSNVFYSFFAHDAPNGTVENREVAMPATMEVRELTVIIGTNGKSGSINVGITKNAQAQSELTKTVLSTDEFTTLTKTGSVTFNATDRISFFVAADPGNGTIEIISFSVLLGQKSV